MTHHTPLKFYLSFKIPLKLSNWEEKKLYSVLHSPYLLQFQIDFNMLLHLRSSCVKIITLLRSFSYPHSNTLFYFTGQEQEKFFLLMLRNLSSFYFQVLLIISKIGSVEPERHFKLLCDIIPSSSIVLCRYQGSMTVVRGKQIGA